MCLLKKFVLKSLLNFFHTTVILDNYEKISEKEQASKNESKNVKVEKSQPTRKQEAHSLKVAIESGVILLYLKMELH